MFNFVDVKNGDFRTNSEANDLDLSRCEGCGPSISRPLQFFLPKLTRCFFSVGQGNIFKYIYIYIYTYLYI